MNKILKLGVFLAVVSAIAGGALAFANEMTAPVIAANNEKTEKAALLQMYPDASESDFEEVEFKSESTTVQKVYKYNDLFIFNMKVSGYKDGTTFLVSINSNDKVIDNFLAMSNGDTKGLGSKVLEDDFKNSLLQKSSEEELDTISGATVSSQPVVDAINEASTYVDELK